MLNRIVQIILSVSIVGCTLLNNSIETAEVETYETKAETNETEVEIVETNVTFEQNPDIVSQLKDEIHETRHWDEGCYDDTLQFTQHDAYLLMKMASAEAQDQGWEGQLKVMEVIINRVESPDYPNTIAEVIFDPHQFQPIEDGRFEETEPDVNSHIALAELEKNKNLDKDIIAFEATWNEASLLRYYDLAYTFRGHSFYVKK